MLDIRWRAFAIAVYIAILPAFMHAQERKVTLTGTMFVNPDGSPDYCNFFFIGAGESESIQMLSFSQDSYLCDYFKGSNSHAFTIVITP